MCEHRMTGGELGYWALRLLRNGRLIEAFHWDRAGQVDRQYEEGDEVLVGGCWTTEARQRFQIHRSVILTRCAANDSIYELEQQQLTLKLSVDS
ncbi:MAG: hypothetical protein DBP01_10850 [gamma proteobacterium symbiont of Ctena orbiculata]|nr:MAG: hypothetical protein DBP01_10850 [gamma proteobacterium symbiont of Ctena orbiculata]